MTIDVIEVLLIDNDMMMAGRPGHMSTLPRHSHLTQTRSFEEASHKLRRRQFDVLVINSGYSATDHIHMIKGLREQADQVPIVVISDSDDPSFAPRAVHHGAQDVILSSTAEPGALQRAILTSIERKRQEQHRMCHSRRDELTGLANYVLLEERFERALARADRHATLVALVAIDLDQPEDLIAFHSRQTIDRLMPLIGKRLAGDIRETDTLARTRATGFTWLVEGLALTNDIAVLVDRVPGLIADSFNIDGRAIHVTASVGVAVCPFHGRNFPTLLKMAEAAMLDVANLNGDGLLMPPLPTIAEKSRSNATI